VGEVDRAVERVDDPPPGVLGVGLDPVLLGQQGVIGERFAQDGGDQPLARRVGLGDQVARPFLAGLDLAIEAEQQRTGLTRRPLGDDPAGPIGFFHDLDLGDKGRPEYGGSTIVIAPHAGHPDLLASEFSPRDSTPLRDRDAFRTQQASAGD